MQSRGKVPRLEESRLRWIELFFGNSCPVSSTDDAIIPGSATAAAIAEASRPRRHAKHRQAPRCRSCLAGPFGAEQQQDPAGLGPFLDCPESDRFLEREIGRAHV